MVMCFNGKSGVLRKGEGNGEILNTQRYTECLKETSKIFLQSIKLILTS